MSEVVPPQIVLLSDDLLVIAHVRNIVEERGWKLRVLPASDASGVQHAISGAAALIVDLGVRGLAPEVLQEFVRGAGEQTVTIAFGPHVHAPMLQAAQAAGFRHVVPRGRFLAATMSLLGNLVARTGR